MTVNQLAEVSTEELIDRVVNGEKPLYELIVRRYNAPLYKIGRSYNFNHEDTQDLMQDTYIAAFNHLSQFKRRSNFKTWLIRIMLNECYHRQQKFRNRQTLNNDMIHENLIPMFSATNNHTLKEIHTRELRQIIESALSKLPEDYRIVFCLREINGLHVAETSSLLGITEANVKVRLNRAKSMLRTAIEKSCSTTELFEFDLRFCDPFTERVMRRILQR